MNPRAFLNLAKRLLANEKNPEGLRSTVSRAYYAAFNVAAEFLEGISCGVPKGPQGHELAYHYLNNCGNTLLIEAGRHLHDLRGVRNDADYHLNKPHVENENVVRNWVDMAGEIIKRLDDCIGSAQRKKDVRLAVQKYKKLRQ